MFKESIFACLWSLILTLVFALSPLAAADNVDPTTQSALSCEAIMSRKLWGYKDDFKAMAEFPAWARLQHYFSDVSDDAVDSLFKKISQGDLVMANTVLKSSGGKKRPEVAQFIDDLVWLNTRAAGVFWSKPEPKVIIETVVKAEDASEDEEEAYDQDQIEGRDDEEEDFSLRQRILIALQKAKVESARRNRNGLFGTHPDASIKAVSQLEEILLSVAVSQPGTQSFALRRFVQPLYGPTENILGVIDYIRKESRAVQMIDAIVRDVIEKRQQLKLSDERVKNIEETLYDTPGQFEDLQVMIAKIFGVSVAKGNALNPQDIHIYNMNGLSSWADFEENRDHSYATAVYDLDRLDDILDSLSEQGGGDVYPVMATDVRFLQMRYETRSRALGVKADIYNYIAEREPGVSYTDHWTETEVYYTGSGKNRQRHTREVSRTATRYPSYQDIISDDYVKRGTTRGLDEIRRNAAQVRERESSYLDVVYSADEFLEAVLLMAAEDANSTVVIATQHKAALLEWIEKLKSVKSDVGVYKKWTADKIHQQWVSDVVQDFHDRNEALHDRLENQLRLAQTILGLIEKGQPLLHDDLVPETRLAQMQVLRRRWATARITQGTMGLAGAGAGFWGANADPYVFQEARQVFDNFMSDVLWELSRINEPY